MFHRYILEVMYRHLVFPAPGKDVGIDKGLSRSVLHGNAFRSQSHAQRLSHVVREDRRFVLGAPSASIIYIGVCPFVSEGDTHHMSGPCRCRAHGRVFRIYPVGRPDHFCHLGLDGDAAQFYRAGRSVVRFLFIAA